MDLFFCKFFSCLAQSTFDLILLGLKQTKFHPDTLVLGGTIFYNDTTPHLFLILPSAFPCCQLLTTVVGKKKKKKSFFGPQDKPQKKSKKLNSSVYAL